MPSLIRGVRHLGRYQQIIQVVAQHGLGYLLDRFEITTLLPPAYQVKLRISPSAPPANLPVLLRTILTELGPTFVKIGQFLSTRHDLLPPDIVSELEKLQDTVPPFRAGEAIAIIEAELGRPLADLFESFEPEPLAAASLGQVHAAVLPTGEQVVVKVQRPDIESTITVDLEIIADIAAQIEKNMPAETSLQDVVWEFSVSMRSQLDYNRERRNAERFHEIFATVPNVLIPTTYPDYTSRRIITLERFTGAKVNDFDALDARGIDRPRLARTCVNFILHEIFSGFFHADPHPGNLFAFSGEIVGVIDFGDVSIIDQATTRHIMFLIVSINQRDHENALRAIQGMGIVKRHKITPALRRDFQRLIEGIAGQSLGEGSMQAIVLELFEIARRHQFTMPAAVVSLLEALMMMEGLGRQLDPSLDIFALARPFAQRVIAEQFSALSLADQAVKQARAAAENLFALPEQTNAILERLNDGELRIQTHDPQRHEQTRLLIKSLNNLSFSIVLAAIIMSVGRALQELLARVGKQQ